MELLDEAPGLAGAKSRDEDEGEPVKFLLGGQLVCGDGGL